MSQQKVKNSCSSGTTPILFMFCSVKDLYLCFQEKKNRTSLACMVQILQFFKHKNPKIFGKFFYREKVKKTKKLFF